MHPASVTTETGLSVFRQQFLMLRQEGRMIACEHSRRGRFRRGKCNHRVAAMDLRTKCECGSLHSQASIIATACGTDTEKLDKVVREVQIAFWHRKAGQMASVPNLADEYALTPFPQWMQNRIDLVVQYGFVPMWNGREWLLIEYDPLSNDHRWKISPDHREATAEELKGECSKLTEFLRLPRLLPPCNVRIIRDVTERQLAHRWRMEYGEDHYRRPDTRWDSDRAWIMEPKPTIIKYGSPVIPRPGDLAYYEFVISTAHQ